MSENVIEVKDLTFFYPGGTKALDDVSFTIEKGEYVALMGHNGAGKSTTCLFLNGAIPNVTGGTVQGSVHVMGQNTVEHHVYELALNVGMVLQDPETQLFTSDVRSEVAFAAENLGIDREEILERIEWVLETVRLEGLEKRTPRQLSGGQKQRLAIAAGLVMQPDILVLDEPTSQLDPLGTEEVFSVLRELNDDLGMTIVLASHKSQIVAEYADRIILLDDGRIVADGTPQEIFSQVDLLRETEVKIPDVTMIEHKLREKQEQLKESPASVTLAECAGKLSSYLDTDMLRVVAPEAGVEVGEEEGETHISIENVGYVYEGAVPCRALKGIDLTIARGQFVGLIGQNGAGKTTMLKNIMGLLTPTEGNIYIDGMASSEATVAEWSRKIGLVLQNPDIQLFKMSIEEEVTFGLEKMGLPEDEIERRVTAALEATGLEEHREVYPFNLSFGDRRKLAVAAVVAMRPQVLIFDEPTTGQDYRGRYELVEIARELNEDGTTVIMVTHDMDLVAKYTDHVFVLGDGQLLLQGTTAEVFSRPDVLASTFLAPPQVTQLAQMLEEYGIPPDILAVDELCGYLL